MQQSKISSRWLDPVSKGKYICSTGLDWGYPGSCLEQKHHCKSDEKNVDQSSYNGKLQVETFSYPSGRLKDCSKASKEGDDFHNRSVVLSEGAWKCEDPLWQHLHLFSKELLRKYSTILCKMVPSC